MWPWQVRHSNQIVDDCGRRWRCTACWVGYPEVSEQRVSESWLTQASLNGSLLSSPLRRWRGRRHICIPCRGFFGHGGDPGGQDVHEIAIDGNQRWTVSGWLPVSGYNARVNGPRVARRGPTSCRSDPHYSNWRLLTPRCGQQTVAGRRASEAAGRNRGWEAGVACMMHAVEDVPRIGLVVAQAVTDVKAWVTRCVTQAVVVRRRTGASAGAGP